jgi:hypothetical protein
MLPFLDNEPSFSLPAIEVVLPTDIWTLLIGSLSFRELAPLSTTNSSFRNLVSLSVTSFEGCEGKWLTPEILTRFVNLTQLNLNLFKVGEFDSDAAVARMTNLIVLDLGWSTNLLLSLVGL